MNWPETLAYGLICTFIGGYFGIRIGKIWLSYDLLKAKDQPRACPYCGKHHSDKWPSWCALHK